MDKRDSFWPGRRARPAMGRALLAAAALAAVAALAAWATGRDRVGAGRDLVLIQIDTLRADHVGVYGGGRLSATPRLDRLARRGAWFAEAWAPAPWTPPSTMSLMTSLHPAVHGLDLPGDRWASELPSLPPGARTLAEVLRDRGYRTLAVTGGGGVGASLGFARGFDRYFEPAAPEPEDVASGAARAIEWLDQERGRPIFLFFHTYEVHAPNTHGAPASDPDPARRAARGYDQDLAFADAEIGRLLDALEGSGRLRRAVVVIVSDHGENLHDRVLADRPVDHGHHLFAELLRVPLIVVAPGLVPAGGALAGPASLLDVMPTALSLLGVPTPGLTLQGRDLRGVLQGWKLADRGRELFAGAPLAGPTWRAVRTASHTLIESPPVAGDNWWNRVVLPPRALYDRHRDPRETVDVAAARGEVADELAQRLTEHAQRNEAWRRRIGGGVVRVPTGVEAEVALRALGYLGGGSAGR